MKNSFLTKPNYIRIYGHRGARGDIVENSLEGFKYTFDLGIKAIEFDVVVTKDNIPILFHDYRLNKDMVKDLSERNAKKDSYFTKYMHSTYLDWSTTHKTIAVQYPLERKSKSGDFDISMTCGNLKKCIAVCKVHETI